MPLKQSEPTNPLTPRQLQLLKAIASFQLNQCYSPTIAELASGLGVSRTTAFEHIVELQKKALLSASCGRARSLNLTSKAHKLLDHLAAHSVECLSNSDTVSPDSAGIPLLGRVAAGAPIEAVENREFLSVDSYFASGDDTFALEVTGDSMIDEGIRSGDYVICRKASSAENGQLVIAIVDNENATLKRFYKEKTNVRLQPANDDYQPIYSDNCRIQAVVTGLVRKF